MPNYILPECAPEVANNAAGTIIGTFITALNEMCDSRMADSFYKLQMSKFYRHEIKKYSRLARNEMDKVISYARLHLRKDYHEYYTTYVDYCTNEIKPHINILYYSILQAFTKANVADRELIANMETDRILLLLACQAFDEIFNDIKVRTSVDVSDTYRKYRPTATLFNWDKALALIIDTHKDGNGVNLNKCEDVKLAYKIIQTKFVNASFLDVASEKTIAELGEMPKLDMKENEEK